jgi:hypothetical protein
MAIDFCRWWSLTGAACELETYAVVISTTANGIPAPRGCCTLDLQRRPPISLDKIPSGVRVSLPRVPGRAYNIERAPPSPTRGDRRNPDRAS